MAPEVRADAGAAVGFVADASASAAISARHCDTSPSIAVRGAHVHYRRRLPGPQHEREIRRHGTRRSPRRSGRPHRRRWCGEPRAIVANERHQRAVGRQGVQHVVDAGLRPAALGPELGALCGQRLFCGLAVAARGVGERGVLRGGHRARSPDQQVRQALLRGSQCGASGLRLAAGRTPRALPRGDFVQDQRAAANQGRRPRRGCVGGRSAASEQIRFEPSRPCRRVVESLAFWQRAQHQVQMVASGRLGRGRGRQRGAAVAEGGQCERPGPTAPRRKADVTGPNTLPRIASARS